MRLHTAQLRAAGVAAVLLLGGILSGTVPAKATAVPGPAEVSSVAFATASAGWAIGTDAAGGSGIWHTSDGGASWQQQWLAHGKGTFGSLTATDPAHAWVVFGRELLGTTDGGAVWRQLATLPRGTAQVDFATADLGVATVDACAANLDLTRCPGQLLVSDDGGASWASVLRTGPMPVFAVASTSGRIWAAEPAATGVIAFFTSADDGRSWSRMSSAKVPFQLTPDLRMTLTASRSQLDWTTVFDQLSCAMHGCSADLLTLGASGWKVGLPTEGYPDYCGPASIAVSAGQAASGWLAISRNGAACSPPLGLVWRFTGSTGWQQLPPWQLSGIGSVDGVNAQVAYAIGDLGTLSRTTDGGHQWTQLLPAPVPAGEVDAVGAGLAFGAQDQANAGAIVRDDGPSGWAQIADLPGVVTQLDFPSPQDGAAVSYAPGSTPGWRLWTSTNGGTSWAPGGPLPKGQQLLGPWLTATGQGLLLTENGAEPWAPQNSGSDPVREWLTSDWGATWHQAGPLQLGKDTLGGAASFVYADGAWTGWLSVINTSYNYQLDSVTGLRLSPLAGKAPTDGVQLTGPGTGFAWTIDYSGHAAVLTLDRTTDDGRSWQHSTLTLPASQNAPLPLIGFSSARDGWLIAGDVTLVTGDGGQSWHT
jgi:photosystem II stability/assembly factor-like uncharacterized protein